MRFLGALASIALVALAAAGGSLVGEEPSGAPLYLGQPLPGREPALFAPGIVSTGLFERDVAMTPDAREIYFGLIVGETVAIASARLEGGRLGEPEIPAFAGDPRFAAFEPHIAPDGKRLLFLSTRPPAGKEPRPGWFYQNIWAVDRKPGGGWGEPYDLGAPINTDDDEFYPSVTRDGTLYFTRSKRGTLEAGLWRARRLGDRYQEP